MTFLKQWFTHKARELWTPADQPFSVGAWFDCADTDTFTYGTGNEVQIMDDKWNNNNLSAYISSPEANVRTLNGLNVLDFVLPDRMQLANRDIGTSGNHIAIGVFTADSINSNSCSYWSFNSTPNNDYQLEANRATYFQGELNNFGTNIQAPDVDNGAWGIWCGSWDFITNELKYLYLNGTLLGSAAYSGVKLDQTQEQILMANRPSNNYVTGAVAEFLWGEDDITDAYRQKVEGYLAWKWGLESNLPAGHPYKSAPPTV